MGQTSVTRSEPRVQPLQSRNLLNGQHTRQIADQLQDHMALYGYQLIETSIIEQADLFLTKAGDQIAERLFTFERHGQMLALRPEFTAAAAHRYITRREQAIARWQFSGPIFADDHEQTGSQYQHYSAGAELIGLPGTTAEAEIISMAVHGVTRLGIEDPLLVIGHVGLTRHLLSRFALEPHTQRFILGHRSALRDDQRGKAYVQELLDRYLPPPHAQPVTGDEIPGSDLQTTFGAQQMLDVLLDGSRRGETMGGRTRHDIARRLLQKRRQAYEREQIDAALDFLQDWIRIHAEPQTALPAIENFIGADSTARALLDAWLETLDLLQACQIPVDSLIIQPDLARTWDYYTGLVFELHTTGGDQIGGGGRYDELARLIGSGREIPAVGFAYYLDHLVRTVAQTTSDRKAPVLVTGNYAGEAMHWAHRLRTRGIAAAFAAAIPGGESPMLIVQENGSVRFGDRSYIPAQLDELVQTLEKSTT
jgi:ATP phosphoribosyltransferase regulatory subunit